MLVVQNMSSTKCYCPYEMQNMVLPLAIPLKFQNFFKCSMESRSHPFRSRNGFYRGEDEKVI